MNHGCDDDDEFAATAEVSINDNVRDPGYIKYIPKI